VRPKGVFRFGGGVGFDRFDVGRGTGAKPALEDVYTPAQAPGIDEEHNYIHVNGTAGLDWRPSPGYARRGGLYALTSGRTTTPATGFRSRRSMPTWSSTSR
jgi:hypothetical protein